LTGAAQASRAVLGAYLGLGDSFQGEESVMPGTLIIIREQVLGAGVVHISFNISSSSLRLQLVFPALLYQQFPCRMGNLLDKQIGALVEDLNIWDAIS
jgi:hypothetical protein